MRINEIWHRANKMPKNPTKEQRLLWHDVHSKNCQCRKLTPKLLEDIKKFKKGSDIF